MVKKRKKLSVLVLLLDSLEIYIKNVIEDANQNLLFSTVILIHITTSIFINGIAFSTVKTVPTSYECSM